MFLNTKNTNRTKYTKRILNLTRRRGGAEDVCKVLKLFRLFRFFRVFRDKKTAYFPKNRSQYSVSSFDSGASGLGLSFVLGVSAF